MSAQHTQGRIAVRENGEANSFAIMDDQGDWLLSLLHNGKQVTETQRENLRRLAACWNFCEGFDTEGMQLAVDIDRPGKLAFSEAQARMLALQMQRDELLAALKAARKSLQVANDTTDGPIRDTIWHGPAETLFDFMDAAIAKVEGGAA